jgi:hypothetical protein
LADVGVQLETVEPVESARSGQFSQPGVDGAGGVVLLPDVGFLELPPGADPFVFLARGQGSDVIHRIRPRAERRVADRPSGHVLVTGRRRVRQGVRQMAHHCGAGRGDPVGYGKIRAFDEVKASTQSAGVPRRFQVRLRAPPRRRIPASFVEDFTARPLTAVRCGRRLTSRSW